MSSGEKLPAGTLCAVCDDVATGKHYSVSSCNGCKTFFRRAIVNKRNFLCDAEGNCAVNKGVRCACRACRLTKCLAVGMNPNSIQSARDRIGYTKRTRRHSNSMHGQRDPALSGTSHAPADTEWTTLSGWDDEDSTFCSKYSPEEIPSMEAESKTTSSGYSLLLERLTRLENNFNTLLNRDATGVPYTSLDEALHAPSRFSEPNDFKKSSSARTFNVQAPSSRAKIIALYIDWAKTFTVFQKLPQADKVALIKNHASSYMIMCEAFRSNTSPLSHKQMHRNSLTTASDFQPQVRMRSQTIEKSNLTSYLLPFGPSTSMATARHSDYEKTAGFAVRSTSFDRASGLQYAAASAAAAAAAARTRNMSGQLAGARPDDTTNAVNSAAAAEPSSMDDVAVATSARNSYKSLTAFIATSADAAYQPNENASFDCACIADEHERPASDDGLMTHIVMDDTSETTSYVTPERQRKGVNLSSLTLNSLTPISTIVLDFVTKPFHNLEVTTTEIAVLQAIMFFDPDAEGLDAASQRNVAAEQKKFIGALYDHLSTKFTAEFVNHRFRSIILRISVIRRAAMKNRDSLELLDICTTFSLSNIVKETVTAQPPQQSIQQMDTDAQMQGGGDFT